MAHTDIILGEGVIRLNGIEVAVTRGGSQLMIERTYKTVIADGDFGIVKDRVRKDMSQAKLTLNALELLPTNFTRMYPATQYSSSTSGGITTETWTGKEDIESNDYQNTVEFIGRTMSGKDVVITLENAINLENPDWTMVDKDEVVAQVIYQAAYLHTSRKTEPWSVVYTTNPRAVNAGSTVTVSNSSQPADDFIEVVYTITDASNNPINGLESSDFVFDYGSAAGTLATPFFSANANVYRIIFTDDTAETVTITTTVDGVQLTATASATWS